MFTSLRSRTFSFLSICLWSLFIANGAITHAQVRAYVTNFCNGTVSVIETSTNTVIATIPVGSTPDTPALTPDGSRLYVSNRGDGTVAVVDTATNTVVSTIPVAPFPSGLAI